MKWTKIVTGSIGNQPTVVVWNNYQVTYQAGDSIYWCGDRKGHSLVIVLFNLYCIVLFIDGLVPLTSIGGIGDVDDTNTEEDISTVYKTGTLLYPLPEILVNHAIQRALIN